MDCYQDVQAGERRGNATNSANMRCYHRVAYRSQPVSLSFSQPVFIIFHSFSQPVFIIFHSISYSRTPQSISHFVPFTSHFIYQLASHALGLLKCHFSNLWHSQSSYSQLLYRSDKISSHFATKSHASPPLT
jgi:hypothetical protein